MDPSQTSKTEVLKQLLPGVEAWVCLFVILGTICCLIVWIRAHWREDADDDASLHKMLTQFQESRREGVLSEEEYRLIKSRLVPRIKPTTVPERQESGAGSQQPGDTPPGGEPETESAKGVATPPSVVPQAGEAEVLSNVRVEDTSRLPS